ncbi:hypothetical protein CHARACLAT_032289 [Characodon lateralis]|uniref:Uncharacterized protein n=1 Tax=Characodon lateralis TaxID=208331 RepID=A0ABU7DNJ7_9TELE|nr:hypothetical protein [Characodon lateralis]
MCLTPQVTRRLVWSGSQEMSKIWGNSDSSVRERVNVLQHQNFTDKSPTLSEWPVAMARTRPLLQSQIHTVFLASSPTEANRYDNRDMNQACEVICIHKPL